MVEPNFINFLVFLAFLIIAKTGMTFIASKYPDSAMGQAIAILA